MTLNDPGKLAVFVLVLVITGALVALDQVSSDAFMGVALVIVGYVTGNGNLARKGKAPSPMVGRADTYDPEAES